MRKVILIVEDDEDNRDLVVFVLKRCKIELETVLAENRKEAVDAAI